MLLGVLVFAANALILTGHLSGDRPSESVVIRGGDTVGRDARNTPSEVAVAAVQNGEIGGTQANSPASPAQDTVQSPAPHTIRSSVPHPPKDEQTADLDEPHPAAHPVSDIPPEGAELAAIGTNAAVIRVAPSATAAQLFAFPLGRRVRVGERENGFAEIEDLGSGEVGWVEEAALGPAESNTQRAKREAYADSGIEPPAISKPRAKGRWARQRGRKGGLLGRLMGRF